VRYTLPDGYADLPPGKLANVVTCLEMTAPASLRPEPAGVDALLLERRERPDPAWYRRLFKRIGEPYLWFSRLALSDEALRAVICDPGVEIFVASSDGVETGMLELDFRTAGECELVFFGVAPELLGTGAGRWLMNRAIETAWSHPIRRFHLHTCTLDHPGATAFYLRSGFTPYKRQLEVYDDPRQTGLLSRDAAPGVPLI
jgi:GNAT superfamily N-acetyltransferase